MNADLIVDFPHQRKKCREVHFAETAQLHILFKRPNVARRKLIYKKSEYDLMILVVREDVLAVRAARTSRGVVDDDVSTKEKASLCFIRIEHLLTPACIDEVRACGLDASERFSQSRQGQGVFLQQDSAGRLLHLHHKAGSLSKIRLGGYCTCFIRSN